MPKKQILKITVDVLMTAALLLLMSYSLLGEAAHEWVGVGMFALFILHHILNHKWSRGLLRGKYTAFRTFQTVLVLLVFLSMAGSMVSGILLSRYVFDLDVRGLSSIARNIHMLSAYWGFVFMALHLGLHWNVIMGMARKMTKKPSNIRKWILRGAAILIAVYGVYAFFKRDIGNYMLLRYHFAFFDLDEPLILFLLDYAAAMGLFVCLGHYLSAMLRKRTMHEPQKNKFA